MKQTKKTDRTVVEHTSPIWRVLGVALAAGAVAALGYYFQTIGHVDEFATVLVITVFFSAGFWARKRPDRFKRRFGPFGKIASAIRESGDDVREYVYRRPMRVGVALAACYGVAVVVAKSVVVAVLTNIYAWPLAVALGCGVGALVAAPEFFTTVFRRLSMPDEADPVRADGGRDQRPDEDGDEMERARRRRAAGEE